MSVPSPVSTYRAVATGNKTTLMVAQMLGCTESEALSRLTALQERNMVATANGVWAPTAAGIAAWGNRS